MDLVQAINRLWAHSAWADDAIWAAVSAGGEGTAAWREYAHVVAVDEVWLARLEGREPTVSIWPVLSRAELNELRERTAAAVSRFVQALDAPALERPAHYVNSAGKAFDNSVADVLLHNLLHSQYHRGKVNQLLRDSSADPAPVDYIAFVRGSPAAVTPRG